MSSEQLKHIQKIRGFQHQKFEFFKKKLIWHIKKQKIQCILCGSDDVKAEFIREREIQVLPMGDMLTYVRFRVHRLFCHNCHKRTIESFHFLPHPKSRISKGLKQMLITERSELSIRAISIKYKIRWNLIKDIEKEYLAKKYKHIQVNHIKGIGIDEIHIGKNSDGKFIYLTIVRDIKSGNVIHIGDGKGVNALEGLAKKLKKSKLKVITMDMANTYSSWAEENFPKAKIVYDHFHVIKLMNERLDKFRRRYIAALDKSYQSQFKKLRFLFIKNQEDIPPDGQIILKNIREQFHELGTGYMFKENLRAIYANAEDAFDARNAFRRWARAAEATEIHELQAMAKTIRTKLSGIITRWTFKGLSNAFMEGFNNKIRWLIRQAYGFHDIDYLKLKIFQLPSISTQKEM